MRHPPHRFVLLLLVSATSLSALACGARDCADGSGRAGCAPASVARGGPDTAKARRTGPAPAADVGAPPDSEIPAGKLGLSIRRGRALMAATRDSLPAHVGSKLRCASCHLDDGKRATALSLIGVYGRFPQYRSRSDAVNLIEDRVNDCFERSMNGTALRYDSDDMRDMVAYMAWLSRGAPVRIGAAEPARSGAPALAGDTARGAAVFTQVCAKCHGARGEGTAVATPLWGAGSFNIGAGMARQRTAASFIKRNMPYGNPTLTDQQAADVAAYVTSRPRPDFRGKEKDWPRGDAPPDVAYRTLAATKARGAARP